MILDWPAQLLRNTTGFDLDTEARDHCREIGLNMVRAPTVGTHPDFIAMIRELIQERLHPGKVQPRSLGPLGLYPEQCSPDCCRYEPLVKSEK